MKLLEKKNILPFEVQKHCKLNLKDIKNIQKRYKKGESIKEIQSDYPEVTETAIRYWAYNRKKDLKRRKKASNYKVKRIKARRYATNLRKRRKKNGLYPNYYVPKSVVVVSLNKKAKEKAIKLYRTCKYSWKKVAKKLKVSNILVKNVFQSKRFRRTTKSIFRKKKKLHRMKIKQIYRDYKNGLSIKQLCRRYKYSKSYIQNIIRVLANPKKYIGTSLNYLAIQHVNKNLVIPYQKGVE